MRQPLPFYRPKRKLWYVQRHGKQINLGRDENEAWRRYHELMAKPAEEAPKPPPAAQAMLVVEVLDAFLVWSQANCSPRTDEWYVRHIQAFAKAIPRMLRVDELRPFHLTDICTSKKAWSANTKHGFCRAVQRAFRWADEEGRIPKNPIAKVKKPAPESRSTFVTFAEYGRVLTLVRGHL